MTHSATFYCAACGKPAGSVSVVPSPSMPGNRLVITGFMEHTIEATYGPTFSEALPALAAGDARALYDLDESWAPFYCPTCDRSYCGDHWHQQVEFDDGFYDCTYGTCPQGHRRMVDD